MPLKAMERCALVIVIITQVRLLYSGRLTSMPTIVLKLRKGLAGRKLELQTYCTVGFSPELIYPLTISHHFKVRSHLR